MSADEEQFDEQDYSLLNAAQIGDLASVRRLVKAGASLRVIDTGEGNSALHFAVQSQNVAVVKFLVSAIAKSKTPSFIDATRTGGFSALHDAAAYGNINIARILLENNATVDGTFGTETETPLQWAASNGHANMVLFLLENGADCCGVLDHAMEGGCDANVFKTLLEHGARMSECEDGGREVCRRAAADGDVEVLELLLNARSVATIDEDLLFAAARARWGRSVETIKFLHAGGANLNVRDSNGSSLCHAAARARSHELLKFLHNNGVDINARDNSGRTACFYTLAQRLSANDFGLCIPIRATSFRHILRTLVDLGAHTDDLNDHALLASMFGQRDCNIIELLLDVGIEFDGSLLASRLMAANCDDSTMQVFAMYCTPVRLDIRDSHGQTPIDACQGDAGRIAALLAFADHETKSQYSVEILAKTREVEKRVGQSRIAMFRDRVTEICVGLQNLRFPALVTIFIVNAAIHLTRPEECFGAVWKIVCAVKHYK